MLAVTDAPDVDLDAILGVDSAELMREFQNRNK